MSLRLTPEALEAAYNFLKTTPPFRRWKLPPADEVEFRLRARKDARGVCQRHTDGHFSLTISTECVGHTISLMRTMAHEMIHIHCDLLKIKDAHGAQFLKFAAQVCKAHGFDLKEF